MGDEISGALFTPVSSEPSPALIICHGAGEFKENYFELCQSLASRGESEIRSLLTTVRTDKDGIKATIVTNR